MLKNLYYINILQKNVALYEHTEVRKIYVLQL